MATINDGINGKLMDAINDDIINDDIITYCSYHRIVYFNT